MRNNKLAIIGIAAIILVLILAGILFLNQGTSPKTATPIIVPTPPIFQGQPTTGPVLFTLAQGFSLPSVKNWEQYSAIAPNYKAQAEAIVQKLTTKSNQTTTMTGEDEVTIWSWDTGEASLSVSTSQIASFSFTDSSTNSTGISISSLPDTLSLPDGITIAPVSPPSQVSGSINFPYDQSLGQIFRSSYSYTYKGYPLLLSGPDEQSLVVYAEANGKIRHLSVALSMGELKTIKAVEPIKTSDVLYNLNQNRGLFVTSDISGVWENDNPIRFNKVTIKSGRPARLLNRGTKILDPVFILDGDGSAAEGTKTVRYILPGFSQ